MSATVSVILENRQPPFTESCYCAPAGQAFILKLYKGFGGSPALGIDMIEPGSESPSPSSTINAAAGATVSFRFTLLQPSGGPAAARN